MSSAHAVLDVTIATIAGVAAVSVFFPVYVVVALAKTVVRGFRAPSTTRRVPGQFIEAAPVKET